MAKTTTDRLVYSIPEAAHALHCSKSLVYDLVKADKLPHVHLSEKRVVIPVEALERYLQQQANGGERDGDNMELDAKDKHAKHK